MRYSAMVMGAAALIFGGVLLSATPGQTAYAPQANGSVDRGADLNPTLLAGAPSDYKCARYCRRRPINTKKKPKKSGGGGDRFQHKPAIIRDSRGYPCYRMRSGAYYCPNG